MEIGLKDFDERNLVADYKEKALLRNELTKGKESGPSRKIMGETLEEANRKSKK